MTILKLVILTCLATLAFAAEEYSSEKRKAYIEECRKELNVKDEDAVFLKSKEAPKNEVQSCFMECIYKKLGLINKEGKLDKEVHANLARRFYGNDTEANAKMEEMYNKCSQEASKPGEKCSIGKNLRACVQEHFKNFEDTLKLKRGSTTLKP